MCIFHFEMGILRILTWLMLRVLTPQPLRTGASVKQQNWEWAKWSCHNFTHPLHNMMSCIPPTGILSDKQTSQILQTRRCSLPPPHQKCFQQIASLLFPLQLPYQDAGSNRAGMLTDKSLNGLEEPGKLVCCQFFLNILKSSRGIFQETLHKSR